MKLARRIQTIEQRVSRLPVPLAMQPMTLIEFMDRYLDLFHVTGYMAEWSQDGVPPACAFYSGHVTIEKCRELIATVAVEDEKARAAGRPVASKGFMGLIAQYAQRYIDQHRAGGLDELC